MSEASPAPCTVPVKSSPPSAKARKAAARQALTKQSRRWQGRVLRVRFRWLDRVDPVAPMTAAALPSQPVLTLAVAKKQARRAVDRNRVKRLVREWFRGPARTVKPADLLVGLHRPWVRHASEPELHADLADLLGVLASRPGAHEPGRPPREDRPAAQAAKGSKGKKPMPHPLPPPTHSPPPVPPVA